MERQKKLAVLAAVALVLLGVNAMAIDPWMNEMGELKQQIKVLEPKLAEAQHSIRNKVRIKRQWRELSGRLGRISSQEAANAFTGYLNSLSSEHRFTKPDVKPEMNPRSVAGAFREQGVDMSFRARWEELVKFFFEINNTDEFVRIQSLDVTATKDEMLDVKMRLSTLTGGGSRK